MVRSCTNPMILAIPQMRPWLSRLTPMPATLWTAVAIVWFAVAATSLCAQPLKSAIDQKALDARAAEVENDLMQASRLQVLDRARVTGKSATVMPSVGSLRRELRASAASTVPSTSHPPTPPPAMPFAQAATVGTAHAASRLRVHAVAASSSRPVADGKSIQDLSSNLPSQHGKSAVSPGMAIPRPNAAPFSNRLDQASTADLPVDQSAILLPNPLSSSVLLDGRTVACQAACCWPLAKLLDQRASSIVAGAKHGHSQETAAVQARFLRRQAARQRDVAAATALRAYYSWIANAAQLRIVAEGKELLEESEATQAALLERGVAIADPTELQRKQLEIRDQEVPLRSNDQQLAQSIVRLTCCASDPRLVAVEALEIRSSVLMCDSLIEFAIEHRQDLLASTELCRSLDVDSAAAIADLLTPLAGGVSSKAVGGWLDSKCIAKLILAAHGQDVLNSVRRELHLAIELQRKWIQQDVCDKCHALTVAYERMDIAQQTAGTWEDRIASLERLEQLGDSRGEALSLARVESLQSRSTLLSRQLTARLAEVDLAEAMGDLAPRCCRGEAWFAPANGLDSASLAR